jgi:hemerythrin-like domain-containing protein
MDAIEFLKQEHQKARAAFERVVQAPPTRRGLLWNELKPELEAHEKIEDACLYEPLSHDAGPKDAVLAGWRQQHQDEVQKVEGLIKAIGGLSPEDARWLSKIQEVHTSLENHIREEEGSVLPRIRNVWDERRLRQAGTQMEEMNSKRTPRVP